MTDQSFKKSCDINNIVKQFAKTGELPKSSRVPQFGDFSEVPTLEEAFEVAIVARDAFYELPATIRKLIDNDPSKLESFIADKENKEICQKHGLLEQEVKETKPPQTHEENTGPFDPTLPKKDPVEKPSNPAE